MILPLSSYASLERDDRKESTSSRNIMQGASFRANVKTDLAYFSVSPCHLFLIVDMSRLRKLAFTYEAITLAISVFPHPGGP